MAERTLVTLVEEWQTGAFLVLGVALVGGVSGGVVASFVPGYWGLLGFFAGAVLAFLAFSYLRYGR